ncbi:unnamed protein product, partial [Pylaiella littoralis]
MLLRLLLHLPGLLLHLPRHPGLLRHLLDFLRMLLRLLPRLCHPSCPTPVCTHLAHCPCIPISGPRCRVYRPGLGRGGARHLRCCDRFTGSTHRCPLPFGPPPHHGRLIGHDRLRQIPTDECASLLRLVTALPGARPHTP